MNKIVNLTFWLTTGLVVLGSFTMDDEDGKAGHVGSSGEQTCAKSTCHDSFALNSGPGTLEITSSSQEIMSGMYTPGQTYTIEVTIAQSNIGLFGFALEALNSTNNNAGTLTPGTGSQIKQAMVSGVQRKSVTHTQNSGNANNSKTWSFSWTAPTGNSATAVTFYCAADATNEDDEETGDYVYTSMLELSPIVSTEEISINESSLVISPNPTDHYLTIRYDMLKHDKVFGRLYNSQGQLVQLLFAENNGVGQQSKNFDLGNLAAGIYVLHLDAGQQSIVRNLQVQ
jgi:Secretion system C-terminal sorting domain/Reeler domain